MTARRPKSDRLLTLRAIALTASLHPGTRTRLIAPARSTTARLNANSFTKKTMAEMITYPDATAAMERTTAYGFFPYIPPIAISVTTIADGMIQIIG